jgi:hypothetical protein
MALDPTPCPACQRTTRTVAGLCPNCGQAKPDGAVPGWIAPQARAPVKPALSDVLGGLGPYVAGALIAGTVVLAVTAIALAATLVAVAVIAVVVLVALAIAALLTGAGP